MREFLLRNERLLIVCLVAFLFGLFIWPTPYQIVHPEGGGILRVPRIGGGYHVVPWADRPAGQ